MAPGVAGDAAGTALRAAVGALGALVVLYALRSAVRTFILPRSASDGLARAVFRLVRALFDYRVARARSYALRDSVMALYAPVALLTLAVTWIAVTLGGFTLIFRAVEAPSLAAAFVLSGSSLLTLGFAKPATLGGSTAAFSAATVGLVLVALLIAYLPAMYSAFSRRETRVTLLGLRAGSPPNASELLARLHQLHLLTHLNRFWGEWELWFAELEESHTSLAPITFFRSPHAARSWVTAAGAVLDAVALDVAVLDRPEKSEAELCLRAGATTLREIAAFFRLPSATADEPGISVTRAEFDTVREGLIAAGLPVFADADRSWRDFERARHAYDAALLEIAALTMAPYAPWSSDRSLVRRRSVRNV